MDVQGRRRAIVLQRQRGVAHDSEEEIPLRKPLSRQPLSSAAAHIQGLTESCSHLPGSRRGRPRRSVYPLVGGIVTEPTDELVQQCRRLRGSDGAGTVRTPRRDPLRISGAAEVHIWHVERHYPKVGVIPPRRALNAVLPCSIGSRIELDGSPAASFARRESGGHVLPRDTCVPTAPFVEEKTRGTFSQGSQGRHLTLGHVPFGQDDFKAIQADSKYPVTRHPGTSPGFSVATRSHDMTRYQGFARVHLPPATEPTIAIAKAMAPMMTINASTCAMLCAVDC